MSQPFIGEIRMFGGNFAPSGWAFCDGQLLAISENETLFQLIGTSFGGDGITTFGLPDLRGRLPVHAGTGPGLSSRPMASYGGSESETLTVNQIPNHTHAISVDTNPGNQSSPEGAILGSSPNVRFLRSGIPASTDFNTGALTSFGSNQAHSNLMPFLCVHFIIALYGIYPSPS